MFCQFATEENIKTEVWRQFYKREFLINNQIYFHEGILHEDILFSFLCSMKAQRVMNIKKEYYLYRQHVASITHVMNEKRAKSLYIVLIEIFKYWNSQVFPDLVNRAISYHFAQLVSLFLMYKNSCNSEESLIGRSYAEKFLYDLIVGKYKKKQYATLSKGKIEILRKAGQVIIFGAGLIANDIVQILQNENIKINAVAVSDLRVAPKMFYGIEIRNIKELVQYKESAIILIGVGEKYCKDVENELKRIGFKSLMLTEECEKNQ